MMRKSAIISRLLVTPAGFGCKFCFGPGKWWFNNFAVGVLYEIFWIPPAFCCYPVKRAVNRITPLGLYRHLHGLYYVIIT